MGLVWRLMWSHRRGHASVSEGLVRVQRRALAGVMVVAFWEYLRREGALASHAELLQGHPSVPVAARLVGSLEGYTGRQGEEAGLLSVRLRWRAVSEASFWG